MGSPFHSVREDDHVPRDGLQHASAQGGIQRHCRRADAKGNGDGEQRLAKHIEQPQG